MPTSLAFRLHQQVLTCILTPGLNPKHIPNFKNPLTHHLAPKSTYMHLNPFYDPKQASSYISHIHIEGFLGIKKTSKHED